MKYNDKPYDEAFEISQDLSVAESYDGRDKVTFPNLTKYLSINIYYYHLNI